MVSQDLPTSPDIFASPVAAASPDQTLANMIPTDEEQDTCTRRGDVPMRWSSPHSGRRSCRNRTRPGIFRSPGRACARKSARGPDEQSGVMMRKPSTRTRGPCELHANKECEQGDARARRPAPPRGPAAGLLTQTPRPQRFESPGRRQGLHPACWAAAPSGTPCTSSSSSPT